MPLTAPPTIPLITDPSTFAVRAQDWVVWQAEQLYPTLVSESLVLGLSLSGSSVTSNTVGTGSKSFTVETGKGFAAGQSIVIADSATPTNRMFGVVDTYDSGTGALVFISQAFEGSGTLTDWTISPTLNAVLTAAQVPDGLITNAKLANSYINDLTTVTLDIAADYVSIADGSDDGNKKKALIPIPSSIVQSNSNVTVTDAGTGKVETTIDGTVVEELTLAARKSTIDGGSVLYPEFKCRAWVNFNGTGTVAIRASGNVSSITDNGTGIYTVNFAAPLSDANYAVAAMAARNATDSNFTAALPQSGSTYSASACEIRTRIGSAMTLEDSPLVTAAFFR